MIHYLQHFQRVGIPNDQSTILPASHNELAVLGGGNTEDVVDVTLELDIALLPTPGEKYPFRPPGGCEVACGRRWRVLRESPLDEVAVLGDSVDVGVAGSERGGRGSVHPKARGGCSAERVLGCEFAVYFPFLLGDALTEAVGNNVAVNICSIEADFVYRDVSTKYN